MFSHVPLVKSSRASQMGVSYGRVCTQAISELFDMPRPLVIPLNIFGNFVTGPLVTASQGKYDKSQVVTDAVYSLLSPWKLEKRACKIYVPLRKKILIN